MTSSYKSYLFAGLTILAWSTVSTAFELSLRVLSPLGLLLISSTTALVTLSLIRLAAQNKTSTDKLSLLQNVKLSLLPGLLNPLVYYLVLLIAYDRLPAQEAQVLNYTWAIVLAVFSILINKEKFRYKDFLALFLSLFGVLVISSKGRLSSFSFDDPLGSALALGSSLIWASYWIINMRDKRDSLTKLYYNFLVGTIFVVLFSWLSARPLLQAGMKLSISGFLPAVYVGIFEMGLTFYLWTLALSYSDSTAKLSNLIFVTPFISLIFIYLILGEAIAISTVIGLVLIVISNIYQKTGAKTK